MDAEGRETFPPTYATVMTPPLLGLVLLGVAAHLWTQYLDGTVEWPAPTIPALFGLAFLALAPLNLRALVTLSPEGISVRGAGFARWERVRRLATRPNAEPTERVVGTRVLFVYHDEGCLGIPAHTRRLRVLRARLEERTGLKFE